MGVQVGGHRVGEPYHGVLGQVVEEVSPIPKCVAIGHLDDEPGIALDHQRCTVPARDDVTVDGALQQLYALGRGKRPEWRSPLRQRIAAPYVVDQDVQPFLFVADAGEELLHLGLKGVVGPYGEAPATLCGDHLRRLLDRLGRPAVAGWPPTLRPVQYTVAPAAPSMRAMPRPAPRVAPADDCHPVKQGPVRHGSRLSQHPAHRARQLKPSRSINRMGSRRFGISRFADCISARD